MAQNDDSPRKQRMRYRINVVDPHHTIGKATNVDVVWKPKREQMQRAAELAHAWFPVPVLSWGLTGAVTMSYWVRGKSVSILRCGAVSNTAQISHVAVRDVQKRKRLLRYSLCS